MDVYEVTIRVPRAKVRKVDLGAITVGEDGQMPTLQTVEAA